MNLKKYGVRLFLILMIVLSIILSLKIGTGFGLPNVNKTTSPQMMTRATTDFLLPTRSFVHKNDQTFLFSQEEVMQQIVSSLKNGNFVEVKCLEDPKGEVWAQLHQGKTWLEFQYLTPLPYSLFQQTYHLASLKEENFPLQKGLWSEDEHKLFLQNKAKKEIYVLKAKAKVDWPLFTNRQWQQGLAVQAFSSNPELYILKESQHFACYRSLLGLTAYTTYLQAFFPNPGELETKGKNDNLEVETQEGERLTINSQSGVVSYISPILKGETPLISLIETVNRLGSSLGTLRYFTSDKAMASYINFMEGYPVMAPHFYASVQMRVVDKKMKLQLNQNKIQVPLPCTQKKQLLGGKDLELQLRHLKIPPQKIENLQIFYEWKPDKKEENGVYLEPAWYVEVDQKWQALTSLKAGEQK